MQLAVTSSSAASGTSRVLGISRGKRPSSTREQNDPPSGRAVPSAGACAPGSASTKRSTWSDPTNSLTQATCIRSCVRATVSSRCTESA